MMSFPAANPLAAIGAPLGASVSFVLAPAVMAMRLALGVLILAVCVVALFGRRGRRGAKRPARSREVAMPNLATGGAHR